MDSREYFNKSESQKLLKQSGVNPRKKIQNRELVESKPQSVTGLITIPSIWNCYIDVFLQGAIDLKNYKN